MPGENYRRRLRSLLLYSCDVFRALINSLVCWLCTGALGQVQFQTVIYTPVLFKLLCDFGRRNNEVNLIRLLKFEAWVPRQSLPVDSCQQLTATLTSHSSVQFNSVQHGIYALGEAHMRSTPSLRSIPNVAIETVPMFVWLTMALSRPFKEDRLAEEEASFHASLLQAIDGVMSLALCQQVGSRAPQHLRSSEK